MFKSVGLFSSVVFAWIAWTHIAIAASNGPPDIGPPAKPLPNMTFRVLPNGTNPRTEVTLIPLAQWQGKPIVILYWKLADAPAETELKAFQTLAELPAYKDKVHFLSAVKSSSEAEDNASIKRARELKLTIPTILDRSQLGPYLEAWFAFPRYGLIDKKGTLRIWHCAKLGETVGPNLTFLAAIDAAANGKDLIVMRGIAVPKNTFELYGTRLANVGLEDLQLKPTTFNKYLTGKPILVGFWSVTCPHCRQVIPAVAKYWKNRQGNLDYVAITRAPSQMLRDEIAKLWATEKMKWPVSYAPENETLSHFKIVKVPTIILADKNGIVKYAWIQPDAEWIGRAIENAILHFNLF